MDRLAHLRDRFFIYDGLKGIYCWDISEKTNSLF